MGTCALCAGFNRADIQFKHVSPRLGFAYSLNDKTVIRGGFGLYFGSLGTRLQDVIQNSGFLATTNFIPTTNNGVSYAANISNPFPNGIQDPVGSALGIQTFLGQSITYFDPNPKSPRTQRW